MEGQYNKQTYDEALQVLKMILAKEECEEPLIPPSGPVLEAPPLDNQDQECKACSFTNDNKRKLSDHEKVHFVRKCLNCQKYIKNSKFLYHKKQCQSLTLKKMHN